MIIQEQDYNIANFLAEAFDSSEFAPFTEHSYIAFIHKFGDENNMTVLGGETIFGDWKTTGLEFESEEDWLIFRLKYSV